MSIGRGKPGKPSDGSVLDSAEELPVLRKIRAGVDDVEKVILRRAPGPELLRGLLKLQKLLSQLERGILKNHLAGNFYQDLSQKGETAANEAIDELLEYLNQK